MITYIVSSYLVSISYIYLCTSLCEISPILILHISEIGKLYLIFWALVATFRGLVCLLVRLPTGDILTDMILLFHFVKIVVKSFLFNRAELANKSHLITALRVLVPFFRPSGKANEETWPNIQRNHIFCSVYFAPVVFLVTMTVF